MKQENVFADLEAFVSKAIVDKELQKELGLDVENLDPEEIIAQAEDNWAGTFATIMLGIVHLIEGIFDQQAKQKDASGISDTMLDKVQALTYYEKRLLIILILSKRKTPLIEGVGVERTCSQLKIMGQATQQSFELLFKEFQSEIATEERFKQLLNITSEEEDKP